MKIKTKTERIILGIDPGTSIMGYGLLKECDNEIHLITLGIIKMDHLNDHALKLQYIFTKTTEIIKTYKPDCMALEAPFFGKNIQSMLKLGRAQGVAMAAGLAFNIPIFEYAPRKIKQAVTGNGNAGKEQVAAMLHSLLKFEESPMFLDATDGLAAAVCHSFQNISKNNNIQESYSGWSAFVKNNQARIK